MASLRGLGLKNFRVFKDEAHFDFAPITVLTGANNSGKSSLFKALMLLRDNFGHNRFATSFDFKGEGHSLASFAKAKCNFSEEKEMGFEIDLGDNLKIKIRNTENDLTFLSIHYNGLLFLHDRTRTYINMKDICNGTIFPDVKFEGDILDKTVLENFLQNEPNKDVFYKDLEEALIDFSSNINLRYLSEANDKYRRGYGNSFQGDMSELLDNILGNERKIMYQGLLNVLEENNIGLMAITSQDFYDFVQDRYQYMNMLLKMDINGFSNILKDSFLVHKLQNNINQPERIYLFSNKNQFFNNFHKEISTKDYRFISYWLKKLNIADEVQIKPIKDIACEVFLIKNGIETDLVDVGYGVSQILPILLQIGFLEKRFIHDDEMNITLAYSPTEYEYYEDEDGQIDVNSYGGYNKSYPHDWYFDRGKFPYFTFNHKKNILGELPMKAKAMFFGTFAPNAVIRTIYETYPFYDFKTSKIIDTTNEELIANCKKLATEEEKLAYLREHGNKYDVPLQNPNAQIFYLEEPETNLHPKLQSLVADILVDACRAFNVQFIVETHSEYFIRKLQYLVGKKEIEPTDVSLYYLYAPDEVPQGRKQVEKINVNPDGSLDNDFGKGFFDEAGTLSLELFRIIHRKN